MQNTRPSRDANIELLRIVSSFFVIVCHTIGYSVPRALSPGQLYVVFLMQSVSKVAVPVFLMITGYTLLPKQDTPQKTLRRVLRIGFVLLLFSLPYALRSCASLSDFSIKTYLINLYEHHVTNAFWYLYAYAGILLMMPLLQRLAQAMKDSDFIYGFIVSALVFGVWPLVIEYTNISEYMGSFQLPLLDTHIIFLLAGYRLGKIPREKLSTRRYLLLFLLFIHIHIALTAWDFAVRPGDKYLYMDNYRHLTMTLASLTFFQLLRSLNVEKLRKPICRLGRYSFGIYLVSDYFLALCSPVLYAARDALGILPAMVLLQVCVFTASLTCSMILTFIPGIRKLV